MVLDWLRQRLGRDELQRNTGVYEVYVRGREAYLPVVAWVIARGGLRRVDARRCRLGPTALAAALDQVVRFGHPRILLPLVDGEGKHVASVEWDPVGGATSGHIGWIVQAGWVRYVISRTPTGVDVDIQADEALQWGTVVTGPPDESHSDGASAEGPWRFPPDVPMASIAEWIVRDTVSHEKANFRVLPPWIQYPGGYPGWGGWRQGSGEVWLHDAWFPFWKALSPEDRDAYLKRWPPPDETWELYLTHYWA